MTPGIWTAPYAKLPLHEALAALHACGWRAFEIATEHLAGIEADPDPDGRIEQSRQCLHDLELSAPQAHAHLGADLANTNDEEREADIKRLFRHTEIAVQLGVQNVVMHPGARHDCTTIAEKKRIRTLNINAFRRLGDLAREHNVRIGIENLMRRGSAAPAELLELLEAINHPAIGITLDTSHAHAAGLNVAECVRELGPHLVATHISDNDRSGDQHLTPGGGTIDWPTVMAAFRTIRYDGLFALEIPGESHPTPDLQALKLRHALSVTDWLVGLAR